MTQTVGYCRVSAERAPAASRNMREGSGRVPRRTWSAWGPSGGAMAEEALPPNDAATRVSRVLVVDDDPDINRLLRARLAALGYRVEAAANGEEALAQLAATPPDLMFLDVAMPGIGGLEVLEQVRAQAADLAVIMTTAFGSEAVAIEALRHGADDYLRKPFERQEFQAVLERAVARLELRRRNVVLQRQLDQKRRQRKA